MPPRNCQPALQSQVPALPLIHVPTLPSAVLLHLRTAPPGQLHPASGGPSLGRWARACCPLQTHPRAWRWHGRQTPLARRPSRPGRMASGLLWAQGPGSSALSLLRFIYLSFVWGEMGENQIQWAVLAAVGEKKGMSVSPERIPRIVAVAPWLGFGRQCPPFSLCPTARPRLPARLSALGPVGLPLPA